MNYNNYESDTINEIIEKYKLGVNKSKLSVKSNFYE